MYQTHLTDKGLGSASFLSAPQVNGFLLVALLIMLPLRKSKKGERRSCSRTMLNHSSYAMGDARDCATVLLCPTKGFESCWIFPVLLKMPKMARVEVGRI